MGARERESFGGREENGKEEYVSECWGVEGERHLKTERVWKEKE